MSFFSLCFKILFKRSKNRKSSMPNSCARCNTLVYYSEEKKAIGKSWHKSCFTCANKQCNKSLDGKNFKGHDGEIYCTSCYGKGLFRPPGVRTRVLTMDSSDSYMNGASSSYSDIAALAKANVSSLQATEVSKSSQTLFGGTNVCYRCGIEVYVAEMMTGDFAWLKTTCDNCQDCHKRLETRSLYDREGDINDDKQCNGSLDSGVLTEKDGEIFCRPCYGKLFGPTGYGYGVEAGVLLMENEPRKSIPEVPVQVKIEWKQPKWGGAEICPRCGKPVYMAEKMIGGGSAWHQTTCFNCKECRHILEPLTFCEREGEIYCKTCYSRLYGPKGYGYGIGSGVLQMN